MRANSFARINHLHLRTPAGRPIRAVYESMRDDKHGGAINRISYEWCVLTTLREKVRCKEVWVRGAHRFRNPDEDLPQGFDVRREGKRNSQSFSL